MLFLNRGSVNASIVISCILQTLENLSTSVIYFALLLYDLHSVPMLTSHKLVVGDIDVNKVHLLLPVGFLYAQFDPLSRLLVDI